MNANLVETVRFTGRLARECLKLGWRITGILAGTVVGAGVSMAKAMPAIDEDESIDLTADYGGEVFDFPAEHPGGYGYSATAQGGSPTFLK